MLLAKIIDADILIQSGMIDTGIDHIYDLIDDTMLDGKFIEIDILLNSMGSINSYSIHTILSILTLTLACRSRLSNRGQFVNRCLLHKHATEGLFIGLV